MVKTLALISPFDNFLAYGLRLLSSYLRINGINTKLILLPTYTEVWQILAKQNIKDIYNAKVTQQILDVVSNCDAVGITMMTMDKSRVEYLIKAIKPLNKPIILGGIHPTAFPDDVIKMADYVCVGEGFEPILEWCKEPSRLDIENFWVRTPDGSIHKNSIRQAIPDIDVLEFPDYGIENHWILYKNNLCPMTKDLRRIFLGRMYNMFASIGCPFSCNYCINNRFKKLGVGYNKFRTHSVEYIINEIKYALTLSPIVQYINFPDDGFIALKEDKIKEFAEKYKKEINLPFSIMGIIPSFLTKRKLDLLVDAGLSRVRAGFQSGNPDTLRFYRRAEKISTFKKCNDLLQSKKNLVFPYYDIMTDNVFIDSEKDALETINFLLELKGRFTIQLMALRMYPGTELHKRALEEGIDDKYFNDSLLDLSSNILNYILSWFQCSSSKLIPKLLLKIYYRKGNIKVPNIFFKINFVIFPIRCGIEHLRKGDMSALPELAVKIYRTFKPLRRKNK